MRATCQIVSLHDKPANASTSAVVSGIVGRTASIRVLSILGYDVEKSDNVALQADGTNVLVNPGVSPSGNYMVEAIEDEGSVASFMITIQR